MGYVIDEDNGRIGFAGYNSGWVAMMRVIKEKNSGYVELTDSGDGTIINFIDRSLLRTINRTDKVGGCE